MCVCFFLGYCSIKAGIMVCLCIHIWELFYFLPVSKNQYQQVPLMHLCPNGLCVLFWIQLFLDKCEGGNVGWSYLDGMTCTDLSGLIVFIILLLFMCVRSCGRKSERERYFHQLIIISRIIKKKRTKLQHNPTTNMYYRQPLK